MSVKHIEKYSRCTSKEFKKDISELCSKCPIVDVIEKGIKDQIVGQAVERKEILTNEQFQRYIDAEIENASEAMRRQVLTENQNRENPNDPYRPKRVEIYLWNKERIKALNKLMETDKGAKPFPVDEEIHSFNSTEGLIESKFQDLDSKGWAYAFRSESDYYKFKDILVKYFEHSSYELPNKAFVLRNRCKTRLAQVLGSIHRDLGFTNTLKEDREFLEIVRVLNQFTLLNDTQLIKDLQRFGSE